MVNPNVNERGLRKAKANTDAPHLFWKDVPGYIGYYQASNNGQISSLDREVGAPYGKRRVIPGIILRQSMDKNGYLNVALCKDGVSKTINVHRVIAMTFIGPTEDHQVNHKDHIKLNNNIQNLEYVTARENILKFHIYKKTGIESRS